MKNLSILLRVSIFACLVILNSCKKDTLTDNNSQLATPQDSSVKISTLTLIADMWTNNKNGSFSDRLTNVFANQDITRTTFKIDAIFVEMNGESYDIQSGISFQGGWLKGFFISNTIVLSYYHSGSKPPFEALTIEIAYNF